MRLLIANVHRRLVKCKILLHGAQISSSARNPFFQYLFLSSFALSSSASVNSESSIAMLDLFSLFLLLESLFFFSTYAQAPVQVPASKKTYGPDGPWNAVSVAIGDPLQNIDLYPGGSWASVIFTTQVCAEVSVTPCGSGGLYSPQDSSSLDNTSIELPVDYDGLAGYWTISSQAIEFDDASYALEDLQLAPTDGSDSDDATLIEEFDIIMYSNVSIVYPDGSKYPPQVGQLSLGTSTCPMIFPTITNISMKTIFRALVLRDIFESAVLFQTEVLTLRPHRCSSH